MDVGANVGRYSEFLLANYSSFRFAFEPLPGAFERLKRQKQMFGPRVVLVNKGCADRSGSLELHFGVDSSELASFSPEVKEIDHVGKANVNSMIVEIISLDEFFDSSRSTTPTRCDLLKIDTKGFEYEVLKGALRFIENYRLRIIQIKFDLQNLF